MNIQGKAALITGASSGIGAALARNLAARGAKLALLARRRDRLEALAADLSQQTTVTVTVADVTEAAQVQAAVAEAAARLGGLDLVVNNAGLGYFGPLEDMLLDDLDKVVKTNIHGLLHVVQAALPHLKESHGMIVNISSALSKRALPYLSAYAGTKSMIDALSDGLRLELRPYGIKVLNYCPPETKTEFHANASTRNGVTLTMPGRKMAKPEDVAERIARAIIAGKREVNESRTLHWMAFLAPRMVDSMFAKMVEKQRRS